MALLLSILVGAVWLALDMLTKWVVATRMTELQEIKIIPGFFSIQFVYNPGAAFGLLAHQQWLFIAVTLGVIGGMLYYIAKPESRAGLMPWALGLLLGGAAGNLIDRLRFGKVVDFFLFYWRQYLFPNFNVADIGITVGVGLLILHLLMNGEKQPSESA